MSDIDSEFDRQLLNAASELIEDMDSEVVSLKAELAITKERLANVSSDAVRLDHQVSGLTADLEALKAELRSAADRLNEDFPEDSEDKWIEWYEFAHAFIAKWGTKEEEP